METTGVKSSIAIGMMEAASSFIHALSPEQRDKACFEYLDGERMFWYYPPMNRHGLPLRDMDQNQRELAYFLMSMGLTEKSYRQAKEIIELETVLGALEKKQGQVTFVRDPELYYFTVFGDPSGDEPWGWRVEGHHVSLHFSLWGGKVISTTPFFFGSNPAEVRQGPRSGLRILSDREDIAFDLMNNLDKGQREMAIIYDRAPFDILTSNSSTLYLPAEEGLPVSKMSKTQKEITTALVKEYVNQIASELSQERLAGLTKDGINGLHFAWAGPTEMGQAHYYRIHGGDFVVEFDNRQNEANHVHSVWRDASNDFATDVMREHLLAYHVL